VVLAEEISLPRDLQCRSDASVTKLVDGGGRGEQLLFAISQLRTRFLEGKPAIIDGGVWMTCYEVFITAILILLDFYDLTTK
jgi:hypothetical protein